MGNDPDHKILIRDCQWLLTKCLLHQSFSDLVAVNLWRPQYDDHLSCGCMKPWNPEAKAWMKVKRNFK